MKTNMTAHGITKIEVDTLIREDYEITKIALTDAKGNIAHIDVFTSHEIERVQINTSRNLEIEKGE